MQLIQSNTRSLGLLMALNWDRLLYGALIALSLGFAAYIASITFANPSIL